MTQVSRKGFVDKNGQKVVIVPPKEEYAGEDKFQNSDAIDTILSEGVHHISYKKDGKKYPTQHILVVTRDYGKTGPIAPNREIVHQLLIDDFGGMMKRYRRFTDAELQEPDGEWTEWVSMIPTVDSTITEDGSNPVTGAAIYAALNPTLRNVSWIYNTSDYSSGDPYLTWINPPAEQFAYIIGQLLTDLGVTWSDIVDGDEVENTTKRRVEIVNSNYDVLDSYVADVRFVGSSQLPEPEQGFLAYKLSFDFRIGIYHYRFNIETTFVDNETHPVNSAVGSTVSTISSLIGKEYVP